MCVCVCVWHYCRYTVVQRSVPRSGNRSHDRCCGRDYCHRSRSSGLSTAESSMVENRRDDDECRRSVATQDGHPGEHGQPHAGKPLLPHRQLCLHAGVDGRCVPAPRTPDRIQLDTLNIATSSGTSRTEHRSAWHLHDFVLTNKTRSPASQS